MPDTPRLEPLPYYKWHWQRWRANRRVQRMPWQAKGPYRELLDEFWVEGSLPTDMPSLAEIVGCTVDELEALWPHIGPCFEERDGRLYNQTMDEQRTETDKGRVAMANGGSKGGKASNSTTRGKRKPSKVKALQAQDKPHQAYPKPTLDPPLAYPDIEEKRREEKRRAISLPSEAHPAGAGIAESPEEKIYSAYPRREGRGAALKAIEKAVARLLKGESPRERMDARTAQVMLYRAVQAYASSPAGQQADKTLIPHPATWFNQSRYNDDPQMWQATGGTHGNRPTRTDQLAAGRESFAEAFAEAGYDARDVASARRGLEDRLRQQAGGGDGGGSLPLTPGPRAEHVDALAHR